MSRGPESSAPAPGRHAARHRAPRPDLVRTALRRAFVVTLLPAALLGAIGGVIALVAGHWARDLALNPTSLLWIIVVLVIIWGLWVSLIWRVYSHNRSRAATGPIKALGALGVAVMCAAVTAPMAVGAQYAWVQRDLIKSIFDDNPISATTPEVTEKNPWPRNRVNVLLLGGDGAVHRPGVRTDSVMLASINTDNGKTVLFSLPRNLQDVPFKPGSKLAAAYPNGFTDGTADNAEFFLNAVYRNVPAVHPGILGKTDNEGADAVKLAVSGALGIPVDYYVLVNLAGFRRLVDAIGGITVNINEPVPIGGNTDAHILPDRYLQPGPNQRLNGYEALWFTRGRYGSTDYKRMERQRCAINAITKEASPGKLLRRYVRLARASKDIVRTDIPQKLLSPFVDLASKVKGTKIKSVGFERSDKFDPNDPDFDFVHAAVQAALHPVKRTPTNKPDTTQGSSKDPSKASNADQDCAYVPSGSSTP